MTECVFVAVCVCVCVRVCVCVLCGLRLCAMCLRKNSCLLYALHMYMSIHHPNSRLRAYQRYTHCDNHSLANLVARYTNEMVYTHGAY